MLEVVETVFPREEHGNWLSNTITQTERVASMYLGMYIFTIYIYYILYECIIFMTRHIDMQLFKKRGHEL